MRFGLETFAKLSAFFPAMTFVLAALPSNAAITYFSQSRAVSTFAVVTYTDQEDLFTSDLLDSIVRLWAFSSGSKSQMLLPASTLGSPLTAPVLTSSLSQRVVLPLPPWPQRAMLRMSPTFAFAIAWVLSM